jgi:hypothetical protein
MVDSPIRVQKLNRRKEFFAAQIQEERDRRNKFASSSSSGVGHFPSFQPSSVIPQLASVNETSLQISEIVVSDIFDCFQEDSSGSSISFNGNRLQDDLKLFDLPVESKLISMDVSVSSAQTVIIDIVADDNFHIDLSSDDCDNYVIEEVSVFPISVGDDGEAASSSSILCEGSICRSLLQTQPFVQGLLIVRCRVIVLCDTLLLLRSVVSVDAPYAGIDYSCIPYLNRIDHPCFGLFSSSMTLRISYYSQCLPHILLSPISSVIFASS